MLLVVKENDCIFRMYDNLNFTEYNVLKEDNELTLSYVDGNILVSDSWSDVIKRVMN